MYSKISLSFNERFDLKVKKRVEKKISGIGQNSFITESEISEEAYEQSSESSKAYSR